LIIDQAAFVSWDVKNYVFMQFACHAMAEPTGFFFFQFILAWAFDNPWFALSLTDIRVIYYKQKRILIFTS